MNVPFWSGMSECAAGFEVAAVLAMKEVIEGGNVRRKRLTFLAREMSVASDNKAGASSDGPALWRWQSCDAPWRNTRHHSLN